MSEPDYRGLTPDKPGDPARLRWQPMRNLDGSPPVTPMFIAVIDGKASTSRGHLVIDTADAWDGLGYQLVRVPASTQGVRLMDTAETSHQPGPTWWEQEDAR